MPGAYRALRDASRKVAEKLRLRDSYRGAGVARDSRTLVMMLVGYKPDLWPLILPRFEAALPQDCTVCLVSPGLYNPEIAQLCEAKSWRYMGTATNDVALAQNVCLLAHPDVEMVAKLDEDMFLLPGSIDALLDFYRATKAHKAVDPGFVAPMIPINGFTYRSLLRRLDLLDRFEAQFGTARIATTASPVTVNPAAARWMWEHTAPLAATQARLKATPAAEMLLSPIKFSIGLIVFERAFWEEFRFFPVYRHRLLAGQSTLGGDEEFLCKECVDRSRPIVIHPDVLAGHFSFGPQYAGMLALLKERPELFDS